MLVLENIVVRTAPCPVLTVREHTRGFIGSDLPAVAHAAQNGDR